MGEVRHGWPKDVLFGMAPPWGAYRGVYSDYETAEFRSTGSGLLGGAAVVGSGIALDEDSATADEVRAELDKIVHSDAKGAALPGDDEP